MTHQFLDVPNTLKKLREINSYFFYYKNNISMTQCEKPDIDTIKQQSHLFAEKALSVFPNQQFNKVVILLSEELISEINYFNTINPVDINKIIDLSCKLEYLIDRINKLMLELFSLQDYTEKLINESTK